MDLSELTEAEYLNYLEKCSRLLEEKQMYEFCELIKILKDAILTQDEETYAGVLIPDDEESPFFTQFKTLEERKNQLVKFLGYKSIFDYRVGFEEYIYPDKFAPDGVHISYGGSHNQ